MSFVSFAVPGSAKAIDECMSMTVAIDPTTPGSATFQAGEAGVVFEKLVFTGSSNCSFTINKIHFRGFGSFIGVEALRNFSLYNGDTQIGATIPNAGGLSGRKVVFELGSSFVLAPSEVAVLTIKADVSGSFTGEASVGTSLINLYGKDAHGEKVALPSGSAIKGNPMTLTQ